MQALTHLKTLIEEKTKTGGDTLTYWKQVADVLADQKAWTEENTSQVSLEISLGWVGTALCVLVYTLREQKTLLTRTPLNLTKHYCRKCKNWSKSPTTSSIQGLYTYGIAVRAASQVWLGMGGQGIGV